MPWQFDLCGGHLGLDFANTVSNRGTAEAVDRLADYSALVSFARQADLVTGARERALLEHARRAPDQAERALANAVALREALYRLFAAVAEQRSPDPADVAALDSELSRLRITDDLAWSWRDEPDSLDGFLGAVVLAAAKLVTSEDDRSRVQICEAPDCVWLFYDASKNHSRRWCDMRVCGNRMKARRHSERARHA